MFHNKSPGRVGNCLLLLSVVLLAGCGQSGPKIVRVSGTVTRAGKPVPDLMVHFIPDHGRPSWGATDEGGHYTLHYDDKQEGALVGSHKVFVIYDPPRSGNPLEPGKKPSAEISAILAKYGRQESTPLKIEINKENKELELRLD